MSRIRIPHLGRIVSIAFAATLALSLLHAPAEARKKKSGRDSTATVAKTTPAAKTPARDVKGHFVKGGAAPAMTPPVTAPAKAPAKAPAAMAAPAAAAVAPARPTMARDAKGHFIKQNASAPAAAAPAAAPAAVAPVRSAPATQASAPAGPNNVWVNLDTKVYHKPGTRWYGKTKHGQYMSESDAMRAGYRGSK